MYDCTVPKDKVSPWNKDTVLNMTEQQTNRRISGDATWQAFTEISQPTITTENGEVKNQYYLRPDRYRLMTYGYDSQFTSETETYEVFNQALACTPYASAPKEKRAEYFTQALDETKSILKGSALEEVSYCGINCQNLASYNLSRSSGENYADWIAAQTISERLKRIPDLRARREASAATTSLFCDPPSIAKDAPDLTEAEKQYSLEPHGDNRLRRVSFYTKANAELLKCEIDEPEQGFGKCQKK
jgi:hypothetical protein